MGCYISTNNNRFYAEVEGEYGVVAPVTPANRVPGLRLELTTKTEAVERREKTGTRTFAGELPGLREERRFQFRSFLAARADGGERPGFDALLRAALGGAVEVQGGGAASAENGGKQVVFAMPHGLSEGQAVSNGEEIRFVEAVLDEMRVVLSAPFERTESGALTVTPSVTYRLGEAVPSFSLYDYWSPEAAVQRVLSGCAVDECEFSVNSDLHEISFRGIGAELIDSAAFQSGQGGLNAFPNEPAGPSASGTPVLGHLGQIWMGTNPERIHTLVSATVRIKNNIEARANEFGWNVPRCVAAGQREVWFEFEVYGRDTSTHQELYRAARLREPVSLTLQLGERRGQMCGIGIKSFVPETPQFVDGETKLRWKFGASRASGTSGDEIYVAFA